MHKCVLASASPYFEAMFSGNFKESNENEIFLKDVPDMATFDMVLGGVYAKALHLDEGNVLAVLRISNLLQFQRIENECWEFILARMDDLDNSHEVLALADQLGQKRVYKQALMRVAYNFRQLRHLEVFQEQDPQLLFKLLSSDDLRVNSEEDVVEALLFWLSFDRKSRMKYLPQLIQAIRVPLLTQEVSRTDCVLDRSLICHSPFQYLSTAFAGLDLCKESVDFINRPCDPELPRPHPRKTIFGKIAAVSFSQDKLQVHVFCPQYKEWIRDVVKSRSDSMHSECFIANQTLYSFGTMIKEFDLSADSWRNFTWFRVARTDFSYAILNNELFIIGGRKHRIEGAVQKLNMATKEWTLVGNLNTEREHSAALALDDKIYVFGGRTNDMILQSVEVYSPEENLWKCDSSMLIPRMMPEVVECGGKIYIFGGFQGIDIRLFVTSVECYDPVKDTWEICGEIGEETKTYSISVTVFNEEIYYVLNNEHDCQFGTFDGDTGESTIITFVEKVIDRDHLDLSYCTIHGVN